ncbi:hypothetical protein D915_004185 [Fasciola hepatica]|uniref:Uncharacterized protein n=1 Tax=Fasciola hepatica TaxID=6192 RepID=A0A2H1CFC2_FASHE|nr:hypothetical protein D915_004185 [Fasciola hepatica]
MVDVTDIEQYESELSAIRHLDEDALTTLEKEAGLDGGGSWWIDPSRTPVELDSHGGYDEGAILDVEAQVRAWLRHSFDRNPVFRDHNYHLINRLNELARIQGLVEEAQLQQQSLDLNDDVRSRQVYHSSLSLHANALPNLGASYDLSNPTMALHHFDVHRSLEGSLSQQQQQQFAQTGYNYGIPGQNGSGMLRGSFSGYGSPEMDNTSRSSSQLNIPPTHASRYEAALINGQLSAKPSGMPQMHKGPKHLPKQMMHDPRKRPSYPGSTGLLPLPDATNSPDRAHGRRKTLLSRTYSKEQLDLLRDNEADSGKRKTSAQGSLLDNLLRPNLTSSLPLSDGDSEADVSKSLDASHSLNPLSQSLSAADMLSVSNIKPNMSYSSMRSSDVFEMARIQESHLRKHSGSRNKLNGSSGSLNNSSLDMRASADQVLRASISGGQSNESSISKLSDVDLTRSHDGTVSFRNVGHHPPERQVTVRARDPKDDVEDEDNRRTLIMQDNGDQSVKIAQPDVHVSELPQGPTGDHEISEPPTPVISGPLQTGGMVTTATTESRPANIFFSQPSTKVEQDVVPPSSDGASTVTRLDSFEMLEARMSSDTVSPNELKSTVPQTPALSNLSHGPNTGPSLSDNLPMPKQPPRSGSPTPSQTQRPSNARPPTGQPVAPVVTAMDHTIARSRLPTRLPAQSRIPSSSNMPTGTRTGVRPPTAPQLMSSGRSQPNTISRPSSTSSSSSRPRMREPMSQIQPNTAPTGRIAVRSPSFKPKLDGSHPPRPTTSQPQVTRSDVSPVRSSRMNSKRLGQNPSVPSSRRM